MAGIEIKFTGLYDLVYKLDGNTDLSAVKTAVQENADEMNATMKRNTKTAFTKGYSTGDTASSINTTMSDGGMTAEVAPGMSYDSYVEIGTRFMEAEPFVKPAFDTQKQKFKKDMDKLVK